MIRSLRDHLRRVQSVYDAIFAGGFLLGMFVDLDTRRKTVRLEKRLGYLEALVEAIDAKRDAPPARPEPDA